MLIIALARGLPVRAGGATEAVRAPRYHKGTKDSTATTRCHSSSANLWSMGEFSVALSGHCVAHIRRAQGSHTPPHEATDGGICLTALPENGRRRNHPTGTGILLEIRRRRRLNGKTAYTESREEIPSKGNVPGRRSRPAPVLSVGSPENTLPATK